MDSTSRSRSGLARFINIPGGITLADAEERASMRLESLSERAVADMEESIVRIQAYLRLLSGAPPTVVCHEIHRLSCCVASLGGSFDRHGLTEAARSLCRLLDDSEGPVPWDRKAVDLHVDAMRILFSPQNAPPGVQEELLAGLAKVRVRALAAAAHGAYEPADQAD
jgi:hypothetical protein